MNELFFYVDSTSIKKFFFKRIRSENSLNRKSSISLCTLERSPPLQFDIYKINISGSKVCWVQPSIPQVHRLPSGASPSSASPPREARLHPPFHPYKHPHRLESHWNMPGKSIMGLVGIRQTGPRGRNRPVNRVRSGVGKLYFLAGKWIGVVWGKLSRKIAPGNNLYVATRAEGS